MLRNFFVVAGRNLLKNKVFSLVNIFGLAIGMTACWFIFEYVRFERSYDRWHVNAARIYRVPLAYAHYYSANEAIADNYAGIGPAMKADFPAVVDFARLATTSGGGTNGSCSPVPLHDVHKAVGVAAPPHCRHLGISVIMRRSGE